MARFPLTFPFNFTDHAPVRVAPPPNFQPNLLYNLVPGQYQIGNRVIGRGMTVRVETCEVKPYDQNNQDYQVSRSDEVRFGQDTLKPSTIELTFDVIQNSLRPGYEGALPHFWEEMPTVTDFSAMWRNDNDRLNPGSMQPLYICGKDGLTRAVFGRPGQFTYTKEEVYDEFSQCLAEFRRADTLSYTAEEAFLEMELSANPVYLIRESGDGPDAWLRIVMSGPLTNPVITIGETQLKLNYAIPEGMVVEISSYPWARRAIDSNGVNLSQYLTGSNQYLDKVKIPYLSPVALKWTSDEVNTFVPALGDVKWEEKIDGYSMFAPPPGFTNIHGNTIVRFDLFNFSLNEAFTWTPRKYLGPGVFQTKCASIYTAQKFNTANQRAETQLVNEGLWIGESALTIMTNEDMSQLVGVMCDDSVIGQHFIRIVSGSWNSLQVRASWDAGGQFTEYDHIGIEYDPATHTYHALFSDGSSDSWSTVASWPDVDGIIDTGEDNRFQGYIFDAAGGLGILQGPGFCNTIAYDTLEEAAQTGQVFLLWRNTWSTIG